MGERMVSYFVSADWSKRRDKRSVYVADLRERRIWKQSGASWNVRALLDLAEQLSGDGPVLIGVDVVLGVPEGYWRLVLDEWRPHTPETFVDWLRSLDRSGEFFEMVVEPAEWRVERPWFKVARGDGGLTSFTNKVEGRMLRRIDRATGAKPVFAVAGIPGTVGSGTRDFWKELVPHLCGDKSFAVWPFEGDLTSLLVRHGVVLCETYPALAYAAALADELPTGRVANSKTKWAWRDDVCNRLTQAEWVDVSRIDLGDLDASRANEDDFDAHVTAAAFLRCIHEGREIGSPEWIDAKAEGSMLLAGVVDPARRVVDPYRKSDSTRRIAGTAPGTRAESGSSANRGGPYPCPIPDCKKVFSGSRGGWDAHVGSARAHPEWRPGVGDPEERKRLFRDEFRQWFDRGFHTISSA